MESNIYKIKKGETDLFPLLKETEKVAKYNELTEKETLSLRLLAEELVSMLPSIVKNYEGEFWIVNNGNCYELCVKFLVGYMNISTRERLIGVSKNNKNSSVVGITGRIREAFDYMTTDGDNPMISPAGKYGFATNIDFSQLWSLKQYQNGVKEDTSEQDKWDEFERSILVKLADDVVVGVKGKNVSITIKKSFA